MGREARAIDRDAVCAVLARAPGLRAHQLSALITAAGGDLSAVIRPEILNSVTLPRAARVALLRPDSARLSADLRWISSSGTRLLLSTDSGYPRGLLELADAPPVLFVRGDPQTLVRSQLAMVGARGATQPGTRTASEFACYFVQAGLTITSGLALGIDAASHEGALRGGGPTIAVCATGLDIIYPTQHQGLARRIREGGALVSEFPPATPPLRRNFPRRNRLISALSLGTLVVEAALQSGSLITARRALQLGREVFAIPGPLNTGFSRGCHKLIRSGATLVTEPSEVLQRLKIPVPHQRVAQREDPRRRAKVMDKGYEMLLDAVGFEPVTVDVLAFRTGLAGESITSMLLALELEGHVAPYPGGRFGRVS
jgi:DNA processing protein